MVKPFVLSSVFVCCVCGDNIFNIYFKENLPEDGHNRWPKHVGSYTLYNKINLHNFICTCWSYFS